MSDEARRLLEAIAERGIAARLFGGMAIRMLAPHPAFAREVADLDFIVARNDARALEELLADLDYEPNREFNALNGNRRLLFESPERVDVFVGSFAMCHTLPLADRLDVRPDTLAPAELLLTKLQIVELNAKDRSDAWALLHAHPVAEHDDGAINARRIGELTGRDWGLHHTAELNLARLGAEVDALELPDEETRRIADRARAIGAAMDAAPKSRGFRMRARIGERTRWYDEPEEIER